MKFFWSERLFRLALRLYPAAHRAAFGEAMAQHFRDLCRDAYAREGWRGLARLWFNFATDTLKNAPFEQWLAIREGGLMRNKTLLLLPLALLGAVIVGIIDSRATEVYATLMVMLPIVFLLGFIEPKRAALWALIIGLSVPLGFLWHAASGSIYVEPPPNGFFTLIALVPAFIGTFFGVICRIILRQVWRPANPHMP